MDFFVPSALEWETAAGGSCVYVVVPGGVTAVSATSIARLADFRSVRLGPSVCTVAARAFAGSPALRTVVIVAAAVPLTLCSDAFADCGSLRSVRLDGVRPALDVMAGCFADCGALSRFPFSAATMIHAAAFAHCNALPSDLTLERATYVHHSAFPPHVRLHLRLRSTLPVGFARCPVQTVAFEGADPITIARNCFRGCGDLQAIAASAPLTVAGGAFAGCLRLSDFPWSALREAGSGAFAGCTSLPGALYLPLAVCIHPAAFPPGTRLHLSDAAVRSWAPPFATMASLPPALRASPAGWTFERGMLSQWRFCSPASLRHTLRPAVESAARARLPFLPAEMWVAIATFVPPPMRVQHRHRNRQTHHR
jgi:hypothetical protein